MIEDSGCSLNEAAAMEKELYWEGGTEDPFHVFRRETGLPEMTLEEVRKHPADETWVFWMGEFTTSPPSLMPTLAGLRGFK